MNLTLFDIEPQPAKRHHNLTVDHEKMRLATERSRALREDLVFESVLTLEWLCGLCSHHNKEIGVLKSKVSFSTPVGDWKGFCCGKCGEFQYQLRVADDICSSDSWQFIATMPAGDAPQPYTALEKAADSFALGHLEDHSHAAYAFVAQARKHGSTDPSLTPVRVSAAGRREFDLDELARYANEVLRGVRSTRPTMTPERWGEAIEKVRELGGAS